jgi:putative membrane protein
MKFNALAMLTGTALALAACGHRSTDPAEDVSVARNEALNQTVPEAAAPAPSGGQSFANAAAASDAFEIQSSQLALVNSQSPAIKAFAHKMIDAHSASTEKLKGAAAAASPAITPDPTLPADQQAKLDALKPVKGAAFDQAYIAAQTTGHQVTLEALRNYAANGEVPSLKSFAAGLVPTVTAHLNMVKGLTP